MIKSLIILLLIGLSFNIKAQSPDSIYHTDYTHKKAADIHVMIIVCSYVIYKIEGIENQTLRNIIIYTGIIPAIIHLSIYANSRDGKRKRKNYRSKIVG